MNARCEQAKPIFSGQDSERRARARLGENRRAQNILRSIGDGLVTTDAKGVVQYLNPLAETLTGWWIGDACGQPITVVLEVVNQHSRDDAHESVAQCLRTGQVTTLAKDTVLISRDGSESHILGSCAPVRDQTGRLQGVVLVFRDVTEDRHPTEAV